MEQSNFNILLIGDRGVGKAAILSQISSGNYIPPLIGTSGFDFAIKRIDLDGKPWKLFIQDVPRFELLGIRHQHRKVDGFFIIYDISDINSFSIVKNLFSNWKSFAPNAVWLLLGNKCDDNTIRQVTTDQGQSLASEMGIMFMETSAKDNINISQALHALTEQCLSKQLYQYSEVPNDTRKDNDNQRRNSVMQR